MPSPLTAGINKIMGSFLKTPSPTAAKNITDPAASKGAPVPAAKGTPTAQAVVIFPLPAPPSPTHSSDSSDTKEYKKHLKRARQQAEIAQGNAATAHYKTVIANAEKDTAAAEAATVEHHYKRHKSQLTAQAFQEKIEAWQETAKQRAEEAAIRVKADIAKAKADVEKAKADATEHQGRGLKRTTSITCLQKAEKDLVKASNIRAETLVQAAEQEAQDIKDGAHSRREALNIFR